MILILYRGNRSENITNFHIKITHTCANFNKIELFTLKLCFK